MALTLTWSSKKHIWTAAAGKKFTVEVRTNKNTPGSPSTLVVSVYGQDAPKGPRATHTAVSQGQTLTAVYITAAVEGTRIELWEVSGQDEQRLTYHFSKPSETHLAIQIN